jgi:uncharacterized protein YeeX (DUF496 family)
MEETNNEHKIKQLKRTIYILLIIFGILGIFMVWTLYQKSETYTQNIQMKDELSQLMGEYESIRQDNLQFQSELSEKDSIILANSAEIEKLINSQADYRKVQRKLELLRNITQDYVHRIDSLIIVNEELHTENVEIRKEISAEREKNKELTKVKTELDEKVTQASTLKAYSVKAIALRVRGSKEIETDKIARTDKIRIDFTLSENKIVPAGSRTIYVRMARPDGQIIADGEGDEYSFEINETRLQYTIKKEIVYNNTAQNIHISWTKRDDKSLIKGMYKVVVFMDNQEIGSTSFELK